MPFSTQRIKPGHLEDNYREERERLEALEAIPKLWAKEGKLWTDDPERIELATNRLGWLSAPDLMRPEVTALRDLTRDILQSGFEDVVLLGVGGAALAAEAFWQAFSAAKPKRRFRILDTTDPEAILEIERTVNFAHTLFVAADKSGKTIEVLSAFFYFHEKMKAAGISLPGPHFIAITDHGSYLERLAEEYGFRVTFRDPPDISDAYAALSYFGILPAALAGADIAAVLDSAREMRAACDPSADRSADPALPLACILAAAVRNGNEKAMLLSTPRLHPFASCLAHLLASSTGQDDEGMVPVAGSVSPPLAVLSSPCVVIALALEGDDDSAMRATLQALEQRNAPVVEIRLIDPAQLGGEFFKWQMATALACAALWLDPFDETHLLESDEHTARMLDLFELTGKLPIRSPRLMEYGIELYAEGEVNRAIPGLQLSGGLRSFFNSRRTDDYVALLAYIARNPANETELNALGGVISERLHLPVLVAYGPQYMHRINPVFKAGPSSGMFLFLTSTKSEDIPVPGMNYSFGQLQMAQALGDLISFGQLGKPSMRLHFSQGAHAGLSELRKITEKVLFATRHAAP